MSSRLAGWSFFYALACLMGTALSFWVQSRGPLVIAGVLSFGSLFYITGYSRRLLQAANLLTLGRLLLTLLLFGAPFLPHSGQFIVGIGSLILIADGLDGWLARHRNEASEFGEYFDKETDAFFLLTLCVLAVWQDRLGAWILIPGLLRYLFVIVMMIAKPKEDKEYRSQWARIIYVVMVISILSVFVLPQWLYAPLVTLATTGLCLSFAHYFKWVWSQKKALETPSSTSMWLVAIGSFLFLNSLLLLPSFITNLGTSTFVPIPGAKNPESLAFWSRGWYDYFLYFFIRRPNQDIFRICVDLVALISIFSVINKPRFTRSVIAPLIILLFFYELYDALVYSFFHRPGIVIEDAQYWLNLIYIIRDALSTEQAPLFILAATTFTLLLWMLPGLLNSISRALHSIEFRTPLTILSVLFWLVVLFFSYWFGPGNPDPVLRSTVSKIGVNFSESIEQRRTIASNKSQPVDQVYSTFASTQMRSKPDIFLFFIESYGSVVYENKNLNALHTARMTKMDSLLQDHGWLVASKESSAPVSGGLSWLSMSSALAGLYIDNKAQYSSFLRQADDYPHMVNFFKNQGYTTITLQPPNRLRPGLPLENPFNFDYPVYFEELQYTGKPYGVWIIPDQYSLEFTHETYIKTSQEPVFLFFETASTHAPWTSPPPLVDDWRTLNNKPSQTSEKPASRSFFDQIRESYHNRFNREISNTYEKYYETISYNLDVVSQFIENHATPNSLFIIMGDHQPPLLKSTTFNTPIHVITKDSTLFQQLNRFRFYPGLVGSPEQTSNQTHAGLYSMLIDLLKVPEDSTQQLPSSSFRPNGIAPSILP